jgi:hypothetical protein
VYADGVETEQTSGYDAMSAGNFYAFLRTVADAGGEAPQAYAAAVERMYDYIAYAGDQAGYAPRNGDSDLRQPWASSEMEEIRR